MNTVTDLRPYHQVPDWLLDLPGDAHRVYAALATFANHRTERCDPSIPAIAERAKRSEGTVRKGLRALADAGAITITHRQATAGDAATCAYNLTPARVVQTAQEVVQDAHQGVVHHVHHHGNQTKVEPEVTPNGVTLGDQPARIEVADLCALLADQVEATTDRRPAITKAWEREMRLTLDRDNWTAEQVEYIIRWLGRSGERSQFWSMNVRCPAKLRGKMQRLVDEVKAERRGPSTASRAERIANMDPSRMVSGNPFAAALEAARVGRELTS